ncbi:hypothetical protein ACROYT_G033034 [Oculina patagonica]
MSVSFSLKIEWLQNGEQLEELELSTQKSSPRSSGAGADNFLLDSDIEQANDVNMVDPDDDEDVDIEL